MEFWCFHLLRDLKLKALAQTLPQSSHGTLLGELESATALWATLAPALIVWRQFERSRAIVSQFSDAMSVD